MQAGRSQEITEGIRSTVLRLAGDAKAAASEIGEMVCADRKGIGELQENVREALGRLESVHGDMNQCVERARSRNEELASQIGVAVQTMQFQDRLGQRIGHIVEALDEMHGTIDAKLGVLGSEPGARNSQSRAAELLSRSYTMRGERSVHAAVMGETVSGEAELNQVEIF